MKKFFRLLPAILALLIMNSCDNGDNGDDDPIVWDVSPVQFGVLIVDEDGNNLLDEATEGNWVGADFKAVFKGQVYDAIWENPWSQPAKSRFYMPTFRGLYFDPESTNSFGTLPSLLKFGEFDGAKSQNLEIEFVVPDIDRSYNMEIQYRFKGTDSKGKLIMDGKEVDGYWFKIILPRREN